MAGHSSGDDQSERAEKLAISWAPRGLKLILASADFDAHGKAAPFRANDQLIALEPELCLTLVHSVSRMAQEQHPFGPGQPWVKAMENGMRHLPIKARPEGHRTG